MHVAVTGAAGMIGRKLVARLGEDGRLGDAELERLTLMDVEAPDPPPSGESFAGDLADPATAQRLVDGRPDVIVHLAAVVSGEAEADFDKGYRVNLDGTRTLLETIRAAAYRPRVVLASSIAVFGAPLPTPIPEDFATLPLTSYGTQKAIDELLLADYSRRGFVDGVGIRLPTICIRPGLPNKAASGFFSNILREPLAGKEAILPVPETVRHWHATPRSAVGFLQHAATMDLAAAGPRRGLTMPGLSATVGEQIAALKRVAGEKVAARIKREPDAFIMGIVDGWPRNFEAKRARQLGFTTAENTFDDIIRIHIEDELGGNFVG